MGIWSRFVVAILALAALAGPVQAGVLVYGSAAWTNKDMSLRAGPGATYDVVGQVPGEIRVRVERCTDRWCAIRTETAYGWVSLDQLSFGQDPGTPFDGPEFQYAIKSGGPGKVCFFTGASYTGRAVCSPSGFVVHDLVHYDLDNAFASVTIEGNVSVQVCRDFNFRSYCEKIVESTPHFGQFLSRAISSYRVY